MREALRAAKRNDGLVNSETATDTKHLTSKGPSSPPERLPKITRKAVGSASNRKHVSKNTVIVNGRAQATWPNSMSL